MRTFGYARVSTSQLARQAGIVRSTVYKPIQETHP